MTLIQTRRARGHVHDIDSADLPSGAASDLATVLAVGNDTGQQNIVNNPPVDVNATTYRESNASGLGNSDASSRAFGSAQVFADSTAITDDGTAYARNETDSTVGTGSANSNSEAFSGAGGATASLRADATGLGTANTDAIASTVDNIASAVGTATASGLGGADVRRTATANGGNVNAKAEASTSDNGNADATVNTLAEDGTADSTVNAATVGSGAAKADNRASSIAGNASALNVASAANGANVASFGVFADATRAEVQCNGFTLYDQAAAAPTTFQSLFYRDTTAVTGRMYMWDFVTAAYVPISPVF
jgi:hypothetical protein